MIYSINEGLLNTLKKYIPNTRKEEFERAFKDISELGKKFESYEGKILSASKNILERYAAECKNLNGIKDNFYKGKPTYLKYELAYKENYKNNMNDEFEPGLCINIVRDLVKSLGFKDLEDDVEDSNVEVLAIDSSKYPNIEIRAYFDDIFSVTIEYKKNPVVLIKENTKHESTIFEGTSFI